MRAKCTRQRWWAAPCMHLRRAATRPACWSEMTKRTPDRPRLRRLVRNSRQNSSSSESPTPKPSTSRSPWPETPVAMTTALDTTWWSSRTCR